MMFRPILITPPAESPVTLEEIKAYCEVSLDTEEDDALLESLREAAVSYLDGFRGVLGRGIINQEWEVELSAKQQTYCLPVPDVSEAAIFFSDPAGDEQSIPAQRLVPLASGTRVDLPQDFVFAQEIDAPRLRFTMGFGGASDVHANIKLVVKILTKLWYEHDPGSQQAREIPPVVHTIIDPFRCVSL
jgi:uncharacterized phiE125 gp8 family phage protein